MKSRRNFVKKISAIGGLGLVSGMPFISLAKEEDSKDAELEETNQEIISLTILQTTDVHCQVHAHDELFWENGKVVFRKTGGYAALASYFASEKKKKDSVFIVDTGDMFQGSELSVKTTGEAMLPILNAMDYQLFLPGNWEVVYYKKAMQNLLGSLHAPKICANMYHDAGDGKRGEMIFLPYHIWNVKGIKIGFIGYTDPLVPIRQSPNYSKGIVYAKPEENLAHYVDLLKNQEHCSSVILLAHLGLSQQIALANSEACKGVDYILGGDTHERVRKPIVCKYSKVVEPGAFGSFVGKLHLQFKKGLLVKDEYELVEIGEKNLAHSKQMEAIIQQKENAFKNDMDTIIGYSSIPLYRYFVIENTIDTLITDALHWKYPEVDIVLSNGFRFCPPLSTPDHTGNIPITESYLYDMLPVNSQVRTGMVSGKQLHTWLEKELNNVFAKEASERIGGWLVKFKGMEIRFHAYGPQGSRLEEVRVGGLPLSLDKMYRICACERDGDPADMLCRFKNVLDAKNTEDNLHGVLKGYLSVHSPVTPMPRGNAVAIDAPQSLLSQISGVDYQFY